MRKFFKRLLSGQEGTESSKRFVTVGSAICLWVSLFMAILLKYGVAEALIYSVTSICIVGIGGTVAEKMFKKDKSDSQNEDK